MAITHNREVVMIPRSLHRATMSGVALAAALGLAVTSAEAQAPGTDIVRVQASGSVPQVVAKLKKMVAGNGMMVMGSLNQGQVLSMTGLHVESETLFVGNPQVGKKLFTADPGVGLVVPIRVNIYRDAGGRTMVSYLPPSVLLKQYGNQQIDAVAEQLDMKLHKMVGMLGS
jgi:uncharacterized protein (DUF302 family)